jgi:mRNA interferase HigB
MRVITMKHIREFCRRHPRARQSLLTWAEEAAHAAWKTPQDIKNYYPTASFMARNRVVFNIKGNEYRLVVAIAYRYQAAYIKFIGTHAEYDAIDVLTVEMD